ncbi:MAG: glycosyltransferase family 2 protein [Candidatus Omnitrophica bacterium]|nr:glycosyltransferase family 2 protein [Candidatus Omnitrophota bacterium]
MDTEVILRHVKRLDGAVNKKILVYIPCYNCAGKIRQTFQEIPNELHGQFECLIIDNHSADNTKDIIEEIIREEIYPFKIHFISTDKNLGYAGSQKLAYHFALQYEYVSHVIMLHGDGQYPPILLKKIMLYTEQDFELVYGYRTKRKHSEEETPWPRYITIKTLSWIESCLLGIKHKEWYSGFVMYRTDFLRKIPLEKLSSTMHIDGEFLMCAHILNAKTRAVSIYKRYKAFKKMNNLTGVSVIVHIFQSIYKYRRGYYRQIIHERRSQIPVL